MDWHYCPMCAEPVTVKPDNDPGCFLGFTVGAAAVIVLVMVLESFAR